MELFCEIVSKLSENAPTEMFDRVLNEVALKLDFKNARLPS